MAMTHVNRRDFLARTGLALGAGALAANAPLARVLANSAKPFHPPNPEPAKTGSFPRRLDSWEAVRDQFPLSRERHPHGRLLSRLSSDTRTRGD